MRKTVFCCFLFATLVIGLWSCSNPGSVSVTKEETTVQSVGGPLPAFQVSADTAQTWMKRWVDERKDMVTALNNADMAADTTFLVYGFHLPRLELDSMLNYLGPDPNVWAMLAIKYDAASQKFVPELVFAAEPNNSTSQWSYYDFTLPCPNSCPDDKQD